MEVDPRRRRFAIRFSFATLLVFLTCVCGYLGGYRAGHKAANKTWQLDRSWTIVYNVADLLKPQRPASEWQSQQADLDNLSSLVEHAAGKDQPPGSCEIRPYPPQLALVVTGNGLLHRRVENLMSDLRKDLPVAKEEEVESRDARTALSASSQK